MKPDHFFFLIHVVIVTCNGYQALAKDKYDENILVVFQREDYNDHLDVREIFIDLGKSS